MLPKNPFKTPTPPPTSMSGLAYPYIQLYIQAIFINPCTTICAWVDYPYKTMSPGDFPMIYPIPVYPIPVDPIPVYPIPVYPIPVYPIPVYPLFNFVSGYAYPYTVQ